MKKIRPYLTIAITAILFVGLVIYRYGLSIYNADQVVFATMLVDIRSGFSLADWEWPANTHFFPELFFYLILNFILRFLNPTFIHQLFPLFATFLFFLAVYWISWEIFDFEIDNKKIWLSSIVLLISLLMAFANKWTYFLAFVFQPALHGVAYTGTLLCLLLVFKIQSTSNKQNKSFNRLEIFLFCSVFLFSLSESFFIIWFGIPICISLLVLKKRKDILPLAFSRQVKLISIASILGYIVHKIVIQNTSTNQKITIKRIIESVSDFADTMANNPDYAAYTILSIFASIFCLLWVMKDSKQNLSIAPSTLASKTFWLWNFYSICVSFAMAFIYGIFENRGTVRYFQPLNYAVIFVLFWLSIELTKSFSSQTRSTILKSTKLITISLGVFSLVLLPTYFNSHTASSEYRLYQCLKADDVGVLYSGFWKSKPTYLFSEGNIIPRQVTGSGKRYHHSNNDNWYTFKPVRNYKVAVLDDTKFGKQNFRDGETRSCEDFRYQLLPKEREDYLIELVN